MRAEKQKERDWELDTLASAISSFFKRKVMGEEGKALAGLTFELVARAGSGSSHLGSEQAEKIYENWTSLPGVGRAEENLPLVRTEEKIYFRRFFEYEKQVAEALSQRVFRLPVRASQAMVDFFMDNLVDQVDDQQALAVGVALQKDLLLLTGGPGTGKTRTIVTILAAILEANPGMLIALAAPTGKAAFRMRQSIVETMGSFDLSDSIRSALLDSVRSTTLHRLLGSKIGSVEFRRNKRNPLPHDLVVVDEASMVDLPLMAKLCNALRDKAKLILVGDADQLAPIQGGAVFNGMVKPSKSNIFSPSDLSMMKAFSSAGTEADGKDPLLGNLVCLSQVYRRKGSSSAAVLGKLCDAIRDGKADEALKLAESGDECIRFVEKLDDPEIDPSIQAGFWDLTNAQSAKEALLALGKFRILCAHNHGRFGVSNWNLRAEGLLPSEELCPRPIVVGVNDYSVGLFNGDDGVVLGKQAHFGAEDGTREVARSRLPQHNGGYASSIHRSQGSEFDKVMIVLPPADAHLLTRELLYVAVSRAKCGVILVGDRKALRAAIEQSEQSRSGVLDMLANL